MSSITASRAGPPGTESRRTRTPWRSSVTDSDVAAGGGVDEQPELEPLDLDVSTAERVIEQLRYGIPPAGYMRYFTVGRQEEFRRLEHELRDGMHRRAVLVRANYGSG